ncbi:MAG: TIGR03435 family protein [Acidobacteriota bacterium]|nr:TIGR03435 family protein [Acidobacteriota bacterium]
MRITRLTFALLFIAGASILLAQTPTATQSAAPSVLNEPLIVDVHSAPFRRSIVFHTNISPQRFDMRGATVFEMIEFAYNLGEQDDDRENLAIVGGPTWIDWDRFDVTAMIPSLKAPVFNAGPANRENPNDLFRPILKRVLAERFHLGYHIEDRPLPGFIVTVAKEGAKLAEAKALDAEGNCEGAQDKANPVQYTLTCTSETLAQFIAARDQDFPHTIIDRTGLRKKYDFTLKLTLGPDVHTRDDRARVFTEAFAKQLGLVVTRGGVPQPAFVVDKVDRTPTPNSAEVEKLVPALPDLEFEVASIRLAADTDRQDQIRPSGSQITFSGFNLQGLLTRAWQLSTGAMLGNALRLLPSTRFTILVKLPPDIDGRAVSQDPDQIANMLQKLLIDRFQIKYHWGEWIQPDAYVLFAGTPKMKKADPNSRSFCKYGPAEGEKPARYAGSPYDAEFHCQNVSMAQFADILPAMAGSEVTNRVPDKTGLTGSYDFTVFFTSGHTLRLATAAAAQEAKQAGDATPAPVEGLSVEDGFRKELGLRLEKQPLVLPALLLDHFDQTPTAN